MRVISRYPFFILYGRADLPHVVLGSKSRQFNEVLSIAQQKLRTIFGMELVELQQHTEEKNDQQKEAAEKMNLKKKGLF